LEAEGRGEDGHEKKDRVRGGVRGGRAKAYFKAGVKGNISGG